MKRVAVIGFGFMGFVHSQQILRSEKLQLAAIVEKDKEQVAQKVNDPDGNFSTGEIDVAAFLKIPVYETFEECLGNEELDAVHICLHTDLHYMYVKMALNAGLHVLVEKPFVLDIEQGRELINLANNKGLILMVAHVVRFMSPYKKLNKIIDSCEFGELRFLSLKRFSGLPVWGQWKEKQKDFGSSGGALFDLVIHDIDFAAFVLGQPDTLQSKTLSGRLSEHDYLNTTWKYTKQDITVSIEGGNIFHSNFPFRAEYVAVFEKATVRFSTNHPEFIYVDKDDSCITLDANDFGDGYFSEIQLFAESITSGQLPEKYSPESALDTISLCYRHR